MHEAFMAIFFAILNLVTAGDAQRENPESVPAVARIEVAPEIEQSYNCQKSFNGVSIAPTHRLICPGNASGRDGRPHWGATYPNDGPEGSGPYVSINVDRIPPNCLEHVFYHEAFHSQHENETEAEADMFALQHSGRRNCAVYL